jgi:hypothetical protein
MFLEGGVVEDLLRVRWPLASSYSRKMGGTTMKKTDGKLYARLVCALAVGAFVCCARASLAAEAKPATPAKAPTTLENLMKTFDGESNAHARYLAFAKKADE